MTHDEALEKVRKLLRLAKSDNPNEAATAAAHAQAIMDRHGIEQAALDMATNAPDEPIRDFAQMPEGSLTDVGVTRWHTTLALYVAKHNLCGVYVSGSRGRKTLEIYGRASDVETVRYMYAWLRTEIQRLVDSHGRGMGVVWRRNFGLGAAETLNERLKEQREKTIQAMREEMPKDNPAALLVLNQAIVKVEERRHELRRFASETLRLVRIAGPQGRDDRSARDAGRQAGHSINLGGRMRQIGGGR